MTSPLSANELEDQLTQARVTIDYLIGDVVRLKDELGEAREKIAELERRLTDQELTVPN